MITFFSSFSDQDAILSDLRGDIPLRYPFIFASPHVKVIDGKQRLYIPGWPSILFLENLILQVLFEKKSLFHF